MDSETSILGRSSFFEALREETETYLAANKPLSSAPTGAGRIEMLEKENERLREVVRKLEEENMRLAHPQSCTDKYALKLAAALNRIGGSVPPHMCKSRTLTGLQFLSQDSSLPCLSTSLPSTEELITEVTKHKAFIQHLKASLQELLEERVKERQEHLLTKSRLEALQRTLEEGCRVEK